MSATANAHLCVVSATVPNSDPSPAGCLAHLLSACLDCPNEPPVSVRDLITRARQSYDQPAQRILIEHGIKIAGFPQREAGPLYLYIANVNPWLEDIFRETPWSRRRWSTALRTLPGAKVPRNPVALRSGVKPRVVIIPL